MSEPSTQNIPPGHCENPSCRKVWATLAGRKDYQHGVADGRAEMLEALKALHDRVGRKEPCCGIDEADCPFAQLITNTERGQSC